MSGRKAHSRMRGGHRLLLIGALCLSAISLWAFSVRQTPVNNPPGDGVVRIDLLKADVALADSRQRPDVQVLRGDVGLKHDSMYMYCDSALIYEKTNSVEAFGNVRMEQGDTLFIYGDYLYYDGMVQLAKLREHVVLINRETRLETDSLNYDRLLDLGYYFDGGTLSDEKNKLVSNEGEYSPTTKLAVFTGNVLLTNPQLTLKSEDLRYNTQTKIATINSLAHIQSETSDIITRSGVYNTETEQAELLERSLVINEGRTLTGDSLFYDRLRGYGEAFENVVLTDTVNRNMLVGNYCFYDELSESALATDRAVAIDYSQGDSLFLHADTLRMITHHAKTDTVMREMRAYHKVRMYRSDLQAVCDSLVFLSADSCLTMYKDPVLWHGEEQLLGEKIKIYMNDSTIDWAHIINQALTVERYDSLHYNQLAGREMKAYFENGEIREVQVDGNVLVVYYPVEEKDSTLMFMNYTESSYLRMYLRDRKMDKGIFTGKTTGTTYPLDQIPQGKDKLEAFVWFDGIRPRSKHDIFEWRAKRSDQELRKIDRGEATRPRDMQIKRENRR